MRAVLQRVSSASVRVDGDTIGRIGNGILVLLGVGDGDSQLEVEYLVDKIVNLRIFADDAGKMNKSVLDISGGILVVSQFTLYGDVRRGRRPSFVKAAQPALARELYERFIERAKLHGVDVETGEFQAMMEVELKNDGPVTIIIDTQQVDPNL